MDTFGSAHLFIVSFAETQIHDLLIVAPSFVVVNRSVESVQDTVGVVGDDTGLNVGVVGTVAQESQVS